MSKKQKQHEHSWKALRFDLYERPAYTVMGTIQPPTPMTRIGLECECGVRTFQTIVADEAAARWLYKAEGTPVAIPDAILSAFGDEA